MSVEPAGPKQGGIEHIRSIGCRQDDHRLMTAEAIQLGEDLVEGLLPFVVATAEARASYPPYTVELIDEDDAWRVLPRFVKQVPDASSTNADKQFDELRGGNGIEGHLRFSGQCPRQQSFAGSRRSHE